MEAQFLTGYQCCGITLGDMHQLLQHYEEHHAQPPALVASRLSQSGQGGLGPSGRSAGGLGSQNMQQFTQSSQGADTPMGFRPSQNSMTPFRNDAFNRTTLATVQDMDTLEDMEMDEPIGPTDSIQQFSSQQQQPFQTLSNARIPQVNVNLANTMQGHQGLRGSTPTTPSAGHQNLPLQNNPTVSSVNTPALSTQSLQHPKTSPESSAPGTPGDFDQEFAGNYVGGINMPSSTDPLQGQNAGWSNLGYNIGPDMSDLTIDEPAKRLSSKQGGFNHQQLQMQNAFRNELLSNTDLAKRLREEQLVTGLGGNPVGFFEQEHKPYKCPVIGCEKAYKNQNGLKYHKQVGEGILDTALNRQLTPPAARPPEPTAEREPRRHILHRRSRLANPVPRHRRHGEGEAVPVRGVRQALQESERAEVPSAALEPLQPGKQAESDERAWRTGQPAGPERQRRRRWAWRHGRWRLVLSKRPRSRRLGT